MPGPDAALVDMLTRARAALQFVEGFDRDGFKRDAKTQYAVLHALTLIGEAAKRVNDEVRAAYPTLPWRAIAGLRDVLVDEYHRVALDVVWDLLERDIPVLVRALEHLQEGDHE